MSLQPQVVETPPSAEPAEESRIRWAEIAVAAGALVAFCVAILLKASQLMEPDDYAYRASIIALSHGHVSLSTAQYHTLTKRLSGGIMQWVHLPNGRWISEKKPGYPFYAVFFQWLGILRAAPLFAGGGPPWRIRRVPCRWPRRFAQRWRSVSAKRGATTLGHQARPERVRSSNRRFPEELRPARSSISPNALSALVSLRGSRGPWRRGRRP